MSLNQPLQGEPLTDDVRRVMFAARDFIRDRVPVLWSHRRGALDHQLGYCTAVCSVAEYMAVQEGFSTLKTDATAITMFVVEELT